MADSERRLGPTIDLQGFDLGTDMDTVDEPSRLPLLVVIALVVLAAFTGVVWLAYSQGVEKGRESVSRELTAQQFWKLRKPAAPAYTGLKIYEPASTAEQNPRSARAASARPKVAIAVPALRPTASASPDVPGAPQAASPLTRAAALPRASQSAEPPIKSETAVPSPQRIATHAPTELTKPTAPAPATHPLTEPDTLSPAPTPSAQPARSAAISANPPAPAAAKPAASAPADKAPATAPPAASAAVSGIVLQIGSYKSEAEARASWQSFKSRHDATAGYRSDVKQADLGAKGTWYRLRMGPFPDKKSALETCRKLKADGASCLLAQ